MAHRLGEEKYLTTTLTLEGGQSTLRKNRKMYHSVEPCELRHMHIFSFFRVDVFEVKGREQSRFGSLFNLLPLLEVGDSRVQILESVGIGADDAVQKKIEAV